MNIENLNKLIAIMEAPPEGFRFHMAVFMLKDDSMDHFRRRIAKLVFGHDDDCGTVCCIAGFARTIMEEEHPRYYDVNDVAEWLEINHVQMEKLFMPAGWNDDISPPLSQAIAVVKRFRDTGEISWRIREPSPPVESQ